LDALGRDSDRAKSTDGWRCDKKEGKKIFSFFLGRRGGTALNKKQKQKEGGEERGMSIPKGEVKRDLQGEKKNG